MGFGDFIKGVGEAGGKALDVATDVASGHVADTAIDWLTEVPFEKPGQLATAVGKGINWGADKLGEGGDMVQRNLDAAGLPKPVGSAANFFSGGGAQWIGRSVGDITQTAGFLGQNVDTALKGTLSGAQYVQENPSGAGEALKFGANWAANHKMDIAKGVGSAAVEEATDPVSLALMFGTGGGSALIKGAAEAGAKGLAEGGVRAAAKEVAASAGESLLRSSTRSLPTEGLEAVAEGGARAGTRTAATEAAEVAETASRGLLRDTFTGRNLPAAETPGAGGIADRAIEATKFRPNPTGRIANARAGWAESIVGEEGGIFREALANRVRAGGGKPMYGGDAAVNAWRAKNAYGKVKHLNTAREGMEIAADPKGYAMKKLSGATGGMLDTVRTGNVTSTTSSSSSVGLSQPRSYSNEYTPRGFSQPSVLPSRGAGELTTGQSSLFEVRDPYAEGTEYGQAEGRYTVRDPYKPLTQPKKQPTGVYSP